MKLGGIFLLAKRRTLLKFEVSPTKEEAEMSRSVVRSKNLELAQVHSKLASAQGRSESLFAENQRLQQEKRELVSELQRITSEQAKERKAAERRELENEISDFQMYEIHIPLSANEVVDEILVFDGEDSDTECYADPTLTCLHLRGMRRGKKLCMKKVNQKKRRARWSMQEPEQRRLRQD